MKTSVTVTSRGVVTLPVELYSEKRVREFDDAEVELGRVLSRKVGSKRAAKVSSKAAAKPRARD